MNPKHSIIVPAFNTGDAIRRCIDSIIAQSCGDWELIVVDDGSTDSTPEIIDEYSRKESRIKAIHTKNAGVSSARNTGLDNATGEYVMFVDSDDWIEPDYLRQVENYMRDDADIYMLGITMDYCKRDGKVYYSEIKGAPIYRHIDADELYDNIGYLFKTMNMESSCLKSYRRSFLQEYGIRFNQEMIIFEDFYFVIRCLCQMPSVSVIPFIGYHYMVDYEYNPVARRGRRDLYPSIHNLLVVLDILSDRLQRDSYSREIVLRTIADKINVVIRQCLSADTFRQKKLPFIQVNKDDIIRKHINDILRYAGGRFRLQHRCSSAGFPMLAYFIHKYLR